MNRSLEKKEDLVFDFGELFKQPPSQQPPVQAKIPFGESIYNFQLNYIALIGRIREVVFSNSSEGEKLRLLQLLNVASTQQKERKIGFEISQQIE